MRIERIETPIGHYFAKIDEDGVLVELGSGERTDVSTRAADPLRRELEEYFAGRLRVFSVPVAPVGTPFQRLVWETLRSIAFGQLRTYSELAGVIGRPGAARAVGGANGANPIAIVIPCHRVVAASGMLGGYSGGVGIKRALLAIEGHRFDAPTHPDAVWSTADRRQDQLALALT